LEHNKSKDDQIREKALSDLEAFIALVAPNRVLGHCHRELIRWWTRQEAKTHQLVLFPRDHQKSALVAYRVAWEITKNPTLRVLYISSTSNLATKQLKFIKDILTSRIYRRYWPEMVNLEESKREKWTETEISVDHPLRKKESVRDPTIFTAGLTTNITGLHCDIAVLDDIVVDDNAYNEEGRQRVRDQASYLASIAGTDSQLWAVGTRYHPKDLYNDYMEMVVEEYDTEGEINESYHLFELYERQVEDIGNGTGQFLWPRTQRGDGKWFGFNQAILARKKAQYGDQTKFRAQYYNNPNEVGTASVNQDMFQYYDKKHLSRRDGKWFYGPSRLNVFAAVDFAFSTSRKADFTAIVVVGVDTRNNYYVLDIERFKTDKISEYFEKILKLYVKWDFRKIRAEVTSAQEVIVKSLKEDYIRANGIALAVEDSRPTKNKEERIEAVLQPRYANKQIWHFRGGACELLEEELIYAKPPHDDIKDCLSSCIDICIPPSNHAGSSAKIRQSYNEYFNKRFGGCS
jgi:phage terminase large subunit-like protein